MPVHNALPYLDAAIESILAQTFTDFEFIILDDASTDGSAERLAEWAAKDRRIRLVEAKKRLGPVASSQRVAEEAAAAVVARMDADDISHPDRLQQGLAVLRDNPDAGLVASLSDLIDGRGKKIRGPDLWRLVRKSAMAPFAHSAIMYRRDVFERAGGYRADTPLWEDQDLVLRIAAIGAILVIPHSLLQVRQTATSTRSMADIARQEQSLDTMYRQVAGQPVAVDEKIDPRVFVAIGSVILWGGARPRLLGRLLRKGRLRANLPSITALGWTAWASLSPATLRSSLRTLAAIRNAFARRQIDVVNAVQWSPPILLDARAGSSDSTRKARQGKAST